MNYGFIYITTNLLNGKQYVGKRVIKNNKKDDEYLGSGKILNLSILKNGRENFKREILCYCDNEENLKNLELEYIQKFNCIYPLGYNIATTNCGGDVMKNHPQREEINKKRLEKEKSDKIKDIEKLITKEKNTHLCLNQKSTTVLGIEECAETYCSSEISKGVF